ncbi:hypothetical protein [Vibrio sp. SCSIO 43136]|uniref:hypothetical protein n=1 Tax=Vibrio sp. SCSIO 43136 TaxID=2819101 RepID=UPI002074CB28|nr:hypothetical protein [Vibrio sp. SCSIO 43136]USD66970.1 hypothetical protein J4N39_20235 [Vibrio sp. SCSIO 43136]
MMKKQQGAAAIWFVGVFVVLAGFAALGVEGARYLNYKARLGDALETSSLLLAADQAEKVLTLEGSEKSLRHKQSTQLVEKTIQSYLKDSQQNPETSIQISKGPERHSFDYRIAAKTTHSSWMSYSSAPSFAKTQGVTNFAAAQKANTGSGAGDISDVVLVIDHSMSMNQETCTEFITPGIKRLQSAKLAVAHQMTRMFIEQVRKPDETDLDKLGRVAVIPFENGTRSTMRSGTPNSVMCENHLVFKKAGGAGLDEFNWRQELAQVRRKSEDSPAKIAKGNSKMQPYVERALFTEGNMVKDAWGNEKRIDDWLPFNMEEVDIEATIQRALQLSSKRNLNADLPVDEFQAMHMPFNRICRGNMQSIGFEHKWNKGFLPKGGNSLDPFTSRVRMFNSGSRWQEATDNQPAQYLGSWTSSFQGILRGVNELRHHEGNKPLLFVLIAGGKDTPNLDSQLKRLGRDYSDQAFRQDLLTERLIEGKTGLFAGLKQKFPHIKFALIKLQPDEPSKQFSLNYEQAFDLVVDVKYQKASGNTMVGRCLNIDQETNDYRFDPSEMAAMNAQVSQLLSLAGDAFGGHSEIGGLTPRRQ